ncbi:MAG: DMSO reductase [Lysobacteraceae bacterium]|nr:MAG: DMSO reductase [Xanthomonadaceae bacterium]
MNPALSVIFFTVFSGAGLGLLLVGAVATAAGRIGSPKAVLVVAVILTVAGLLSSTLHLGQPLRAWRAFSQWRTSWLSREGVAAVATLILAMVTWWFPTAEALWLLLGLAAAITLRCTAGIYTSLKTVPEWHNRWVLPVFSGLSISAGGLLWLTITSGPNDLDLSAWAWVVSGVALAWVLKSLYWRWIRSAALPVSAASAIGMPEGTEVKGLFKPHTETNYLMREMGYTAIRRHAEWLRWVALGLGALLPIGLLVLVQAKLLPIWPSLLVASSLMLLGQVAERWLFFAEARHVVQLYYRP